MKLKIFSFFFTCLIVFGCNAQKDMDQRRNYMMPQKDELPRNSKYKTPKKKKTYSPTKQKKRKPKR